MDESKKRTVLENILKSEKISSAYNKYKANNKLNKKLIIERIMAEIDGLWTRFNDINKLNRFLESFIANHIKDFLIPKKANDLESVVANNSDKRVDEDPNERLKREIEERKKSKMVIPMSNEGTEVINSANISSNSSEQLEEFINEENMAEKNETSNLETTMNRNNFQQMPQQMPQQMNPMHQQMNPNMMPNQHMQQQHPMHQQMNPNMMPGQQIQQQHPMQQQMNHNMMPNQPMHQQMSQQMNPNMMPNQPMHQQMQGQMNPNMIANQQMQQQHPMSQQMNPNMMPNQSMNPQQQMNPNMMPNQQQNKNFTKPMPMPPMPTPIQSVNTNTPVVPTPVVTPNIQAQAIMPSVIPTQQQEPDRSVIHIDSRERNIVECPKSNPFSIYMNDGTTCLICVRDLVTTNIHNDPYLLLQISEYTKSVYENQLNREVHFKLVRTHKDDSCAYYKNTDMETMIRLRDINKVTFNIIRPNGKLLYSYVDDIREANTLSDEALVEFLEANQDLKDKNVQVIETVPNHVDVGDLITVFEKDVESGAESKVIIVDRVNNRIVLEHVDDSYTSGSNKRILLNKFQVSISLEII